MTKYGDINTEMLIYSQIFRDITSEKFPFKELTPSTSQGTTIRTKWVFFFGQIVSFQDWFISIGHFVSLDVAFQEFLHM